jgi:DNA-binding CsgD family transcriptional regulator
MALDALAFHARLQERKTVAACSALFKDAVAPLGVKAFACGEIDLAERDRNVLFIAEWPPEWARYYVKSGFVQRDPLLNALARHREAFTFGDLIRDTRLSGPDREALLAAEEDGWTQGLAVPVWRGGARFGLVTLVGRGEEFVGPVRQYLCLIGESLLIRARTLAQGVEFAVPPAGMSKREIEAVRLVAMGHTDPEIAGRLDISESTAHKHVESARKRLKARNRAHLAALAVSLGIAAEI